MIGIDEVGRGSLAGPLLVVAAVAEKQLPPALKDSKALTKKQRLFLFAQLTVSCRFGEGWVDTKEIDNLGLSAALTLGGRRALRALRAEPNNDIILDGIFNYLPKKYDNVTTIMKADSFVPIVSAAAVYAKVIRDQHMSRLCRRYPAFGFSSNCGYGTGFHLRALQQYGPQKGVHRMSYRPLKTWCSP